MAKSNNLGDFLTDIADAIRAKKGISGSINAQNFASEIASIESGGGGNGGAGSVFKITNKLNGTLIGGPSYNSSDVEQYAYAFDGGEYASGSVIPIADDAVFPDNNSGYLEPVISFGKLTTVYGIGFWTGARLSGIYGDLGCVIQDNGSLGMTLGRGGPSSTKPIKVIALAFDKEGNYDMDTFFMQSCGKCFCENTLITLANQNTKMVQDVDYNDELLVWNFDDCKYDTAKPLWIKKEEVSNYYYLCTFDNGTELKLVGSNGKCHRLFCVEEGKFISATDMVGKTTYTEKGEAKLLSCEVVQDIVKFYNIITNHHINLFANGVLTSCRYNNVYPIENMKFVKDDRLSGVLKWRAYEKFRPYRELDRYLDGLRLYEQQDISLEDTISYCVNLESSRKTLDEFDGNNFLTKEIELTEVGWIDRDGKAYGFRRYMAGQNNHIILADAICKELGVNADNPSRYLEKEGWVKYTTDFVLNSGDKEINEHQLKALRIFLNVPNKLKKDRKIRLGDFTSPHIDVSEFDTMDKYSFEYRKAKSFREI